MFNDCCSRLICRGCDFANQKRESEEWLERRCPCCQEQMSESFGEEINTYFLNRAKKNDAYAMNRVGLMHYNQGDYNEALEYWINASELGDVYAHYYLAAVYLGQGVEKDEEKEVYHLEHAAIGGHPAARHYLGCKERDKGNTERAATNFIIAANLGYHASLKELQNFLQMDTLAKKIMTLLFVHIGLLWMQQKVQRENKLNYVSLYLTFQKAAATESVRFVVWRCQ